MCDRLDLSKVSHVSRYKPLKASPLVLTSIYKYATTWTWGLGELKDYILPYTGRYAKDARHKTSTTPFSPPDGFLESCPNLVQEDPHIVQELLDGLERWIQARNIADRPLPQDFHLLLRYLLQTSRNERWSIEEGLAQDYGILKTVVAALAVDIADIENLGPTLFVDDTLRRIGNTNPDGEIRMRSATRQAVKVLDVTDADYVESNIAVERKFLTVILSHLDDLLAGGTVGITSKAKSAAGVAIKVYTPHISLPCNTHSFVIDGDTSPKIRRQKERYHLHWGHRNCLPKW
jgi:hypothetical protein